MSELRAAQKLMLPTFQQKLILMSTGTTPGQPFEEVSFLRTNQRANEDMQRMIHFLHGSELPPNT